MEQGTSAPGLRSFQGGGRRDFAGCDPCGMSLAPSAHGRSRCHRPPQRVLFCPLSVKKAARRDGPDKGKGSRMNARALRCTNRTMISRADSDPCERERRGGLPGFVTLVPIAQIHIGCDNSTTHKKSYIVGSHFLPPLEGRLRPWNHAPMPIK